MSKDVQFIILFLFFAVLIGWGYLFWNLGFTNGHQVGESRGFNEAMRLEYSREDIETMALLNEKHDKFREACKETSELLKETKKECRSGENIDQSDENIPKPAFY